MRVILAVDAIFPPLTGIGRYASILAAGLAASEECESLRFFLHDRFVAQPGAALDTGAAGAAAPARVPLTARLRARLGRSELAVRAYAALQPRLAARRLRPYGDHLFHSPNFLLPPLPGQGIATFHDLSTVHHPQYHPAARVALMARAMPEAVGRATALITPSQAVRDEVIAHFGVAPEKVHSIPMGVDPSFRPQDPETLREALASWGLEPGAYILCVATLEPRKNIGRLLDAYLTLPSATRKRYPLVLAGGSGWHSQDLYSRIQRLAAGGEVRALGYVAESALPHLYAGARVFAFPALYEGFGLPVLEAMASGVPVVTSNLSSLPEVAAGAALLVDPQHSGAIGAALERALDDDNWRSGAIAAGLSRAAELGWDQCLARTLELYRKLSS